MKKFVSILLVLVLMMSLSVAAFAAEVEAPAKGTVDETTATVVKVYKLIGAGSSPAETFTLEQVGNGRVTDGDATSAPALGTITGATFAEGAATANGATAGITIELPTYTTVGVYEYTLREVAGNTAGVTYYGNTIKLVVTVINDGAIRVAAVHTESQGTKSDRFENTYSAGTLSITKTVTGNLGDKDKYFDFTVELTGADGKNYGESYAVSGGSNAANPSTIKIGEKTNFKLKNGDTISIANLPYDVRYEVVEADYTSDGYTTNKTGDTGTISAATQTAAFTNDKNKSDIDMGVSMDSLPYILMLVVVGAAVVVIATRKKGEQF